MQKAEEQTNRFSWVSHILWNRSDWFKLKLDSLAKTRSKEPFIFKFQHDIACNYFKKHVVMGEIELFKTLNQLLCCKCFEFSVRISQIIWFRSGLWSAYCKSFVLDRNFGMYSLTFWVISELRIEWVCKSFRELKYLWYTFRIHDLKWWFSNHYSGGDFGVWVANHLV